MATDWPEARARALEAILLTGADVWIALWLGNPIDGGAEITLTGYARVAFQTWTTIDLSGASSRQNAAPITFPNVTAAGTADYWAIHDASVGGVLLRSAPLLNILDQPTPIIFGGGGDVAEFPVNALRIKIMEA
jgi:hypothetical protein